MPRTCTVCSHPEREKINSLLISGHSLRYIARQFDLSKDALARHKEGHIPEELLKSCNIQETINADSLACQIKEIREKIKSLLQQAIDSDNLRDAHNFVVDTLKQIELEAKLEGQLNEGPQILIINTPEWVELRTLIITALEPFPDARQAVINAIHS